MGMTERAGKTIPLGVPSERRTKRFCYRAWVVDNHGPNGNRLRSMQSMYLQQGTELRLQTGRLLSCATPAQREKNPGARDYALPAGGVHAKPTPFIVVGDSVHARTHVLPLGSPHDNALLPTHGASSHTSDTAVHGA